MVTNPMGSSAPEVRENTNLVFMSKSRPTLQAGDVCEFRLLDGPFRFGRVIIPDVKDSPLSGMNLVYIYTATSDDRDAPPLAEMTLDRLLVGPLFVNRQGWLRCYFLNVAHTEIGPHDQLDNYCFESTILDHHRYFDLHGQRIPERFEPCGEWGACSHRTVDDIVSEALGLPLAPD